MASLGIRRAAAIGITSAALVFGIVPGARAQTTSITIQNYQFSPQSVTVPVGTTVQWTNNDPVAHTVTSTSGAFDSGALAHLGHFSFTFTQPGTYSYYCQIHDYMTGTIVVTSGGGQPTSTATAVPTAPPTPTATPTSTAVIASPTTTPTTPRATNTPAPTATDTPVPPSPTATSTSGTTSPGTLRLSISGTLHAARSSTLTVTVMNAKSRPVKGAQIRADLSGAGVKAVKKGTTDSNGRATLTLTPKRAGSIRIRASKSGYRAKTATVKVRAS